MHPKKLQKTMNVVQGELMVQETCIAELIHSLLCITGMGCIFSVKSISAAR